MPYLVPATPILNKPSKSLIYGDIFTAEAARLLRSYHLTYNNAALSVKSMDFSAPCHWVDDIRSELGQPQPPRVLVLEFYGFNNNACMGGHVPGSAEFQDLYEKAFDKIKLAADWVGTPVYWATPPPHPPSDDFPDLNVTIAGWAADRDWTVIDAGDAVADGSGDYVDTMACLFSEGAPQGCSGGMVDVRSAGDVPSFQFVVEGDYTSYSSGALRWATALVTELPEFDPSYSGCTVWECP